jgi:hypothetical protein
MEKRIRVDEAGEDAKYSPAELSIDLTIKAAQL